MREICSGSLAGEARDMLGTRVGVERNMRDQGKVGRGRGEKVATMMLITEEAATESLSRIFGLYSPID